MSQANKPLKGVFINPQSQHLESTAGFSHQPTEDLGLHRTQIKSNTFERLSKVLLVIFNSGDVKTNQDIFDMFSSYVRVMRVLIFERKEPNTKCFIEMFTLQEATYVKNQFAFIKAKNPHQKHIQIYYAQIQTIDLQNHYSEGQDFQAFYVRNPQATCQYFQDCDQSMVNLPTSQGNYGQTQPNQQSPHHFQQHSFAQFNHQQFKDAHDISVFDIQNSFNDTSNNIPSGIRPVSISSSDHSKQNYRPQHMHLLPPQTGQNNVLSQFARDNNTNNINQQSQRHQATGFIGSGSQQQQQQQPMVSRKRNEIADQFHKDFLMKDGILQTHLNQQFQQQNMSMQRQQQLQQHQASLQSINSPGIGPTNSNNNNNNIANQHLLFPQYGSNKFELPPSQTSSANRSPSSTTYTLPNTLQGQQQQICDLSDVDENVQASQPQTFRTKYRDEMFFNGANHQEDNNNQVTGTSSSQGQFASPDDDNNNNSYDSKRVLFIRHLDYNDLKISMIYNLFSNYGNIVKIIFMKQKRQALIEFESTSQSTAAKEHLNNLLYYGAQIKIDYSKYDQIDLQRKKLYTGEINDQEQVLAIPQQCFRYKPNKAIPQFSPKSTLHVSNIRKEYFDSNLLYDFFTNVGAKVASLKLIPNEKKQMCLVQFETLDDALRVISTLHDTPFHGRNLCISFTKSGNQGNQLGNQSFSNNNGITPGNMSQQQYSHVQQLKNFSNEESKSSSQFQTISESSLLKPVNFTNPFQAFKPQTSDLGNQHHNHLYNEIDDDEDEDSQDDRNANDFVQAQLLNLGI